MTTPASGRWEAPEKLPQFLRRVSAGAEKISTSNFFVVTFRPRLDTESPLSARQTRLFQFVAGRTRTTKEEAATFLAVSGDTALRELRVLRDVGLVERGGVGKAAFYQRAGHRPG